MKRLVALVAFVVAACSPGPGQVPVSGPAVPSTTAVPATTVAAVPITTSTTVAALVEIGTASVAHRDCAGWRDLIAAVFPDEADRACRVIVCESGGDPAAVSSTDDHGLAQINAPTWARPGHPDPVADWIGRRWHLVYEPTANLEMARRIRDAYGWAMWSCR